MGLPEGEGSVFPLMQRSGVRLVRTPSCRDWMRVQRIRQKTPKALKETKESGSLFPELC